LVEARAFVTLGSLLPACKIAITHAGAGTVLASLGAGVPLVLVSQGAPSQIRMARACEMAGVGRSCIDEFGIEAAVSDVLSTAAIATKAECAASYIARMPGAFEVVTRVETLVAQSL
jgi:UDP:flavonoid glycosyltransferase YjiC (YdhE family)